MSEDKEEASDRSALRALFINTSLKKDSKRSHTQSLLEASAGIMRKNQVQVENLHMLDYQIPPGIYPDMRKKGWQQDDWPTVWEKVKDANILVIGTPLWLGEESSVCRVLIERLYAMSDRLNSAGQSSFYGKVGGCAVTGNEDGIKHVAMSLCFALNHLGYTIPPQADCGWIGEAGPGPSYGDEQRDSAKRVGFDNDFTQRNTTIMSWNLIHLARLLKDGIPNRGNDRNAWKAGERFDFENPEPPQRES